MPLHRFFTTDKNIEKISIIALNHNKFINGLYTKLIPTLLLSIVEIVA